MCLCQRFVVGFLGRSCLAEEVDDDSEAAFALLHLCEGMGALSFPHLWELVSGRRLLAGGGGQSFRRFSRGRMPMVHQWSRCGPASPCRWLMRLNMRWSSPAMASGKSGGRQRAVASSRRMEKIMKALEFCKEVLHVPFCHSLLSPGCLCMGELFWCSFLMISPSFRKKNAVLGCYPKFVGY